jgi:hypothetical protein
MPGGVGISLSSLCRLRFGVSGITMALAVSALSLITSDEIVKSVGIALKINRFLELLVNIWASKWSAHKNLFVNCLADLSRRSRLPTF